MGNQLLPDVPKTIFRPAIILGDSRRPETSPIRYGSSVPRFWRRCLFFPCVLTIKSTLYRRTIRQSDRDDSSKRRRPRTASTILSSGTGIAAYLELTKAIAQAGA